MNLAYCDKTVNCLYYKGTPVSCAYYKGQLVYQNNKITCYDIYRCIYTCGFAGYCSSGRTGYFNMLEACSLDCTRITICSNYSCDIQIAFLYSIYCGTCIKTNIKPTNKCFQACVEMKCPKSIQMITCCKLTLTANKSTTICFIPLLEYAVTGEYFTCYGCCVNTNSIHNICIESYNKAIYNCSLANNCVVCTNNIGMTFGARTCGYYCSYAYGSTLCRCYLDLAIVNGCMYSQFYCMPDVIITVTAIDTNCVIIRQTIPTSICNCCCCASSSNISNTSISTCICDSIVCSGCIVC